MIPAYREAGRRILEGMDFRKPSGPFPGDTVTSKSNTGVEYTTPAQTDGLGTFWWLTKSALPISGSALLIGDETDLALLSVRLPVDLNGLTSTIVNQFEQEAARCPCL